MAIDKQQLEKLHHVQNVCGHEICLGFTSLSSARKIKIRPGGLSPFPSIVSARCRNQPFIPSDVAKKKEKSKSAATRDDVTNGKRAEFRCLLVDSLPNATDHKNSLLLPNKMKPTIFLSAAIFGQCTCAIYSIPTGDATATHLPLFSP